MNSRSTGNDLQHPRLVNFAVPHSHRRRPRHEKFESRRPWNRTPAIPMMGNTTAPRGRFQSNGLEGWPGQPAGDVPPSACGCGCRWPLLDSSTSPRARCCPRPPPFSANGAMLTMFGLIFVMSGKFVALGQAATTCASSFKSVPIAAPLSLMFGQETLISSAPTPPSAGISPGDAGRIPRRSCPRC